MDWLIGQALSYACSCFYDTDHSEELHVKHRLNILTDKVKRPVINFFTAFFFNA